MEDLRDYLRRRFDELAKTVPELRNFIESDCVPGESGGNMFDLGPSESRSPRLPYLKVSNGSEHEVQGEFFYTRPAWDGSEEDVKYRYLGRTVDFYPVGRVRYYVEYDPGKRVIVSRMLPKEFEPREGNIKLRIPAVFLYGEVPELGSGIFILEGIRTRTSIVEEVFKKMTGPVKITLTCVRNSSEAGVYWGPRLECVEKVSNGELPYDILVGFLKDYVRTVHDLAAARGRNTGTPEVESGAGEVVEDLPDEAGEDVRVSGETGEGVFEEDDDIPF